MSHLASCMGHIGTTSYTTKLASYTVLPITAQEMHVN